MELDKFIKKPVLGIIRGINPNSIKSLCGTLVNSGLETVEITMNTPNASEMIKNLKSSSEGKLSVGAGTVLSIEDMDVALKSGAEFIVMPVFIEEIASKCIKNKIPFFPGAFTPQEVFRAWESGATMVKVFPASLGGPDHIKNLKGPLDKIKVMAVGGISVDNISDYLQAGADAVAFGASIFDKDLIEQEAFGLIEKSIKNFIKIAVSNI